MKNQQGTEVTLAGNGNIRLWSKLLRYKIGYATDDWGMRSSTPSGIPDPAGAWVRYEDHIAALVEAQQPAPSAAAAVGTNTKTAELLSTTVGLLMGYREGGARQPYKPGSVIAKVIDEAVDHLKDWPYPEPSPTPQADSAPAEAVQRIVHLRADRELRIYVAGPMTGLPEYNFPLFNATAARLRSEGWHVENPAEHGHVEGAGWADYLRWDISRIATCGAIYLLPGWSKSKGATLEVHIAGVLGLQVLLADGAEAPQADSQPAPIDMVLHCPKCGVQHIDASEPPVEFEPGAAQWNNPPHRSHLCHGCGHIWRPADVPTNGVKAVKTTGKADSPIAAHAPADSVAAPAGGAPMSAAGERRLFKEQFRHLELDEVPDAWGRPQFKHSHVDAIWHGWRQRAAIALLDTPPAQAADSVLEDAARLEQIAEAIRDYHYALDTRKHGGVAESAAFNSICLTMGMQWEQGKEADRRTALAANGGKP